MIFEILKLLLAGVLTGAVCWAVGESYAKLAPWLVAHWRMLQLGSRIPGPPAIPILGNAIVFMSRPEDLLDIIGGFFDKYGKCIRFWLGPDLNVCIRKPDEIRLLLSSTKISQKGPLYKFIEPYSGTGILTGGPTWRHHRKIATPAYSKKCVERFADIFNREADCLAEALSKKDDNTFNVYFDVVDCTTQCVCQTLMGLSKQESMSANRMDEVVKETQSVYTFIFTNMTRWWLHIPLVYWLTGRKKIENYYIKLIDDFTSDILKKRRKALEKNLFDEDTSGVVDRFIMSGEMSDKEIKLETFTLFTTSQEASAKIASAVLLFLAHLPEWQDKVYEEIIAVLGPEDGFLTNEQLKKLQYLDMVYKETLRYMSIAAFIQRTVEEEVTIDNGQLTLPVGASVIIPIHMLHRDPDYWEDPYKVDPGRFLPENIKKRDPNAFVPFSLGAMDCLGRVYATSLIKTLAVKVLRRVRLEADGRLEDLQLNVAISVKFAEGYNLRVIKRQT